MSGGLDSQLAIRVLQQAGATVEAVCFATPFFATSAAEKAAAALGVKLHVLDFLDDAIALLKDPPHGFGSAINPCIDCHATMIRRAGELMTRLGYDFVATGEVQGQRPMSQNRQSLATVEKSSGLHGRLVRPLSALLLEPTIPETEGLLDRSKLLDLSGRGRERQIELAAQFGIVDYPAPAGGCKLTEAGFARKMRDLMTHEGLDNRTLVELSVVARRFRLPGGSSVLLGRDSVENARLRSLRVGTADAPFPRGVLLTSVNVSGPTALIPELCDESDLARAEGLVCAYAHHDRLEGDVRLSILRGDETVIVVPRPYDRTPYKEYQIC